MDRLLWSQTVHGDGGRFVAARLWLRGEDGLPVLTVGDVQTVLDVADARSLFAALGEALQS
jgi:hypothetical protein